MMDRYRFTEQPGDGPQDDADGDGILDAIQGYQQDRQMSPEDRRARWIAEQVWKQGMTVDMATGEIIDPTSGQAVGRLPDFN